MDRSTHAAGGGMPDWACDLLVVGSGAGGLATAVVAARLGLEVIVVEKDARVGGTSAWSGGWMWIPNNPLARAEGAADDADASRTYLRHELGRAYDEALVEAFLTHGPRMIDFFQRETSVRFINGASIPDFHGNAPGAAPGNRAVGAAPFDGRRLRKDIRILKPPLDLISPFGMGIATGELRHFANFLRKPRSFAYVVRRVVHHRMDQLRYGRGMYLVNGNALVAMLLKSALDLGVKVCTSAAARSLLIDDGAVQGARIGIPGREVEVRAARGVVLATGGFPHDSGRRAGLFPHAPTGKEHWSAAPETNTGDGLRLGESAGGHVGTDVEAAAGWAPVSLVPRRDGRFSHFPHLGLDRAKPGAIMVHSSGQRFCNEADSYHDVTKALFEATPPGERPQAWLVCDHRFVRRWGVGRVRPAPFPLRPWLRNGYLKRGRTIGELAVACAMDPTSLEETVRRFNEHARQGRDPDFRRGETPFNRAYGDPEREPNPCLGPLDAAPFYAVRIVPGSLSTFAGLATDANARVLDRRGRPIPHLYAVGNDMASIAGGNYPSGGFTLGPAMTFGFIAAHHAAGISLDHDTVTT
ncbi:MAG: FAD-dependent oxidoreductase [Burkholderiales bacterium]|nr:FAD-dependent oxidoreductase [Burkholderiales bacterium]OJX09218.1 MAG: FAD-binding dehydrogenase [Burkholderiales bacterium 70-64]